MGGFFVSVEELNRSVGTDSMPAVIDVRRRSAYEAEEAVLPTARWRDHADVERWSAELAGAAPVVLYCVHGHQISQGSAAILRRRGIDGRVLAGGIAAWRESGGPLVGRTTWPGREAAGASRWVAASVASADWAACCWLLRRFVDRDAEILFVAADQVRAVAEEIGATPFGLGEIAAARGDGRCEFDSMLARFEIEAPLLRGMASIVRGTAGGRGNEPPQSAGLQALAEGIAAAKGEGEAALAHGLVICDALYAWCRAAADRAGARP